MLPPVPMLPVGDRILPLRLYSVRYGRHYITAWDSFREFFLNYLEGKAAWAEKKAHADLRKTQQQCPQPLGLQGIPRNKKGQQENRLLALGRNIFLHNCHFQKIFVSKLTFIAGLGC